MVVRPVSIFSSDIRALTILNKYQNPPIIPVWPNYIAMDVYVFLDAVV